MDQEVNYDSLDHYWIVATNPTHRWAGARGIYVDVSDTDYIAWDAIAGNDATNIDTEANLDTALRGIMLRNYLAGVGYGLTTLANQTADVVLTNPLLAVYNIGFTANGHTVKLPQMNLPISRPDGVPFVINNNGTGGSATKTFSIVDYTDTPIMSLVVQPGQSIKITPARVGTALSPEGLFEMELSFIVSSLFSPINRDTGLSGATDYNVPCTLAAKTYIDTAITAARAYADGLVVGLLDDRGNYDASGNVFPSSGGSGAAGAIKKGDIWFISVAGTLGTKDVEVGDQLRALVDTPGSTAGNWAISQVNIVGAVTLTGTQTLTNKTLTSPAIATPTGIVKGDVGLGNVDNTSNATERAATATLTNKTLTSPVINSPTGIVKGDVGLGSVDNTSDAAKPVSTAQQAYVDGFSGMPMCVIAKGINIDANLVGDTAIPVVLPRGATRWRLFAALCINRGTTVSLTTARLGLFTAPAAGGLTIAVDQALSSLQTNADDTAQGLLSLSLSNTSVRFTAGTVYCKVGTAQGASAAVDIYVYGYPLA